MKDQEARDSIKRLDDHLEFVRQEVRHFWEAAEKISAILEYLGVEAEYVSMTTGHYILVKKETKTEKGDNK